MANLRIEHVSRFFGDATALNDVCLEIPSGTITAIIGPSGSGKTTLLRMLAGLDSPDHGTVHIAQKPAVLGDSALCFQDAPLYPHLNVWDNVAFPLRLKATNASKEAIHDQVSEVLAMLKIDHLSTRKISELSGGQKQRVGIARALVRDVDVYLFDEPMAHLDQALAREIVADLRHIQQSLGLTFVYVTHSTAEAFALADQLVVLINGEVAQSGEVEEVVDKPRTLEIAEFLAPTELNVRRGDGLIQAWRPEDTELTAGGSAVVESVTYLGGRWLVHTTEGAAVTEERFPIGAACTLLPKKVLRF